MGDVAILMKNNFTGIQTILCNGIINIISLVGVIIGLAVAHLSEVAKIYVLVFVAGNFVYIAADVWRHLFKNKHVGKNVL
jgi:zinc transporter ZupT